MFQRVRFTFVFVSPPDVKSKAGLQVMELGRWLYVASRAMVFVTLTAKAQAAFSINVCMRSELPCSELQII